MNLYKSIFYEEFKNKIQYEINNLENEEKNGNVEETNDKILSTMKILEYLKFEKPKIIKENNEIKWEKSND